MFTTLTLYCLICSCQPLSFHEKVKTNRIISSREIKPCQGYFLKVTPETRLTSSKSEKIQLIKADNFRPSVCFHLWQYLCTLFLHQK